MSLIYPVSVNRTARTFLALAALSLSVSAFAATLSGNVTNKTNNKPSAGDDVALLDLMQGMNEAGHTKTDSKGHYSFDSVTAGPHLVQVTHNKTNYFASAPPGTATADVTVYDAAAKIPGVNAGIDVMRIETDPSGATLNIIEVFNVKNASTPPRTQAGDHTFDFYLPDGAVLGDADATAPGSSAMPLKITPTPMSDAKNHYSVDFALKPGESLFQVSYSLPYTGSATLKLHTTLATDMAALMLPKSIAVKPAAGSPLTPADGNPATQTLIARAVPAGQQLVFTVSGTGQLPRDPNDNAQGGGDQSGMGGGSPSATDTRPGGGMGAPIDTPDPLSKYKWWIVGGLLLVMAAVGGVLLSKPSGTPAAAPLPVVDTTPMPEAPLSGRSTLDALKEEIFTLETDRLSGKITEEEYAEHRAALETILKRALKRG
ncbi:MAG: carboxypeptidase regulatory-like domain-containing protein [Acidobacteriaceae bacterium]|nr:carboxypeptidase regulatory-like domain-containing protein [Acidobacteriaceae bacterium]